MKDQNIELPAEFHSGNSVPVTQATIKRERMEEILRDAIATYQQGGNAKHQYEKAIEGSEELDPIERLRFFCSIAMRAQDWLDAEPFFDALIADRQRRGEPVAWLRSDELRKLGRPYSDAPLNAKSDSMLLRAKGTPESAAKYGHDVPVFAAPQPAEPLRECGLCHNMRTLDPAEQPAEPEEEETGDLGIPKSCGKPFCAPNDHHPLCDKAEPVKVPDDNRQEFELLIAEWNEPLDRQGPSYENAKVADAWWVWRKALATTQPAEPVKSLIENQEPLGEPFAQVLRDNLPDLYIRATEPVKVPSDDDLLALIREQAFRQYEFDDLLAFARALLARYGAQPQPSGNAGELESFSAWANDYCEMHQHTPGNFSSTITQFAFMAWQARAALSAQPHLCDGDTLAAAYMAGQDAARVPAIVAQVLAQTWEWVTAEGRPPKWKDVDDARRILGLVPTPPAEEGKS